MRVVAVLGPRQAGKSTLVAQIAQRRGMPLVSLDDETSLRQGLSDPVGFIADLGQPVAIDEVQRAPGLLLAIKAAVDRDPRPGAFLLTGSANLLTAPRIIESLAGRMAVIALSPLSQAEIARQPADNVVDRLFAGSPPRVTSGAVARAAFVNRAQIGGYPEVVLGSKALRREWHASYLETVMTRDLRDLDDIRKAGEVPRLLRAIAARASSIVAWTPLGRDLGLDRRTVTNYAQLLDALYLTQQVPAWRAGLGAREIAAPKVHVLDSGILCHLLNADAKRLASDPTLAGQVFESFCAAEIIRHLGWSTTRARAYHYREHDGRREVDLLLESTQGQLVAIEVKSAATVVDSDFTSLRWFRDRRDGDFAIGVVLYTGERSINFGDRLWALPVSALWSSAGGSTS
jgi:predicted AAA+ superfamily ATPase